MAVEAGRRQEKVFVRLYVAFDDHIERHMRECAGGKPPKNNFLDVLLDYRAEDGQGFYRQMLWSLLAICWSALSL
ncbi:hypothetical protein GUJ93_ZPchr0013g37544 [Zizania palustris]|uniref:Uncharacterized protein n=1 Tax=Zizania palustris TaxID=103762 RepID=A0A8J5WTH9_ZIZPA|nr:hypothetical protein GUJ93_ZPchr0013g37544 [Zizania palustris]